MDYFKKIINNEETIKSNMIKNLSEDLQKGTIKLYRYGPTSGKGSAVEISRKMGEDVGWYSTDFTKMFDYKSLRMPSKVHVVEVPIDKIKHYYANYLLKQGRFSKSDIKSGGDILTKWNEFLVPKKFWKNAKSYNFDDALDEVLMVK